jgi:hypothetical protein
MAITLLLSLTDFTSDKLIPGITASAKVDTIVMEAQEFDLSPLLGDALYYDLLKHKTDANYVKLLSGEEYVDSNNNTIKFPGLKMALKYWAYARHISTNPMTVTTHSVVMKTNPHSEPLDRKLLDRAVEEERSKAAAFWRQAEKYLNNKKTLFPLWKATDAVPRRGVRITAIGGNQ